MRRVPVPAPQTEPPCLVGLLHLLDDLRQDAPKGLRYGRGFGTNVADGQNLADVAVGVVLVDATLAQPRIDPHVLRPVGWLRYFIPVAVTRSKCL